MDTTIPKKKKSSKIVNLIGNISIGSSGKLYCGGCNSGSAADIIEVGDEIMCSGDSSCESSLFVSSDSANVACAGYASCLNTGVDGETYIFANNMIGSGAYSLKDSNIKVRYPNHDFSIKYSGFYAGYGWYLDCANVVPQIDTTCYIDCYASGCVRLTVNCTTNEDYCIVTCDESGGVPCPIVITQDSNNYYGLGSSSTTMNGTLANSNNRLNSSWLNFYFEDISEYIYINYVLCNESDSEV